MYRFRDIYVYVMYYVYVTSGPSLLIESTDSMINTARGVNIHIGAGLSPVDTENPFLIGCDDDQILKLCSACNEHYRLRRTVSCRSKG